MKHTLSTERLDLRWWRDTDRPAFAALNADLRVMEHFPATLSRAESDAAAARIQAHFQAHGFGLWAAEERASGDFIGFIGLAVPSFEASFTPCVEIGWRLAHTYWSRGFATEGALAAVAFAFDELQLDSLVSFTAADNSRSRAVMSRIGMWHSAEEDFDHPALPHGHRLRRHVLYRISRGSPLKSLP